MKKVIILRGVSGSGKSTFANIIKNGSDSVVIVTTDDYFYDEMGNYNFKIEELTLAHQSCRDKFLQALNCEDVQTIIVANSSVTS